MLDFAAIDFETANAERTSVCSVGIIVVRGGEIVHRYYSLIRPEPDYYNYHNTRVHGLTAADTESARIFPDVWAEVEPLIAGFRSWHTTSRSTKVASRRYSGCTEWTTPTTRSSARSRRHVADCDTSATIVCPP